MEKIVDGEIDIYPDGSKLVLEHNGKELLRKYVTQVQIEDNILIIVLSDKSRKKG